MNLISPHLSEAEFLSTQQRDLLDEQWHVWTGTPALHVDAQRFGRDVFEPVRSVVGCALHVNSGYRCPTLNSRVGGVVNSRHMLGLATDIVPIGIPLIDAMTLIKAAMLKGMLPKLDKAIIECGTWIHIQGAIAGAIPRNEVLASSDGKEFHPLV